MEVLWVLIIQVFYTKLSSLAFFLDTPLASFAQGLAVFHLRHFEAMALNHFLLVWCLRFLSGFLGAFILLQVHMVPILQRVLAAVEGSLVFLLLPQAPLIVLSKTFFGVLVVVQRLHWPVGAWDEVIFRNLQLLLFRVCVYLFWDAPLLQELGRIFLADHRLLTLDPRMWRQLWILRFPLRTTVLLAAFLSRLPPLGDPPGRLLGIYWPSIVQYQRVALFDFIQLIGVLLQSELLLVCLLLNVGNSLPQRFDHDLQLWILLGEETEPAVFVLKLLVK